MSKWVDFQEVKAKVTMEMVLNHYGINWLRRNEDELRGRCPLHDGEGERTFHVNTRKNVFHCFSCKKGGNVLSFVSEKEDLSIRDAALKLQDLFLGEKRGAEVEAEPKRIEKSPAEAPEVINPPLGFELRVNSEHEYAQSRGFGMEIMAYFGAGFCESRGMFSGRFVFPLHNTAGDLVGYAGRSIDDAEPKYRFPSAEKAFQKRHLIFNLHREIMEVGADDAVVIVEGFFDCAKLKELGYYTVALMGSSLSQEQEVLLSSHFSRAILLFDGDDAGRAATDDCLQRLGRRMFVKAVDLEEGIQPDQLERSELVQLLMKGGGST